ncbi:hypothetical protein F5Y14DRAFT_449936 [Nemania sp. NC0429]|nr:hypothetical protein F5Y14DRAFT_449936 [Nemania sp. NC0429]
MGHHHGSKSSHSGSKSSSSKSGKKGNGATHGPGQAGFSFLFVINEISINPRAAPNVDQWGARMPPENPHDYEGETQGTVFRYRDGAVEVAEGYYWYREQGVVDAQTGLRPAGSIVRLDGASGSQWPMETYSAFTVFNCWGPLPCVYEKADALSAFVGAYGAGQRWNVMSFQAPDPGSSGLTRVSAAGNSQVVTGKNPSWMPSIVPELFWNASSHAPTSTGLGGELPVIIAQMALSQPRGQTDVPFLSRWWHHGHWLPGNHRNTVRHPLDIRGVLVVVALDNYENPLGSSVEHLQYFENGAVVRE